jgi:hypothetical protein
MGCGSPSGCTTSCASAAPASLPLPIRKTLELPPGWDVACFAAVPTCASIVRIAVGCGFEGGCDGLELGECRGEILDDLASDDLRPREVVGVLERLVA